MPVDNFVVWKVDTANFCRAMMWRPQNFVIKQTDSTNADPTKFCNEKADIKD
jgi:hypothetical protein